jgi:hypothetical protein
MQLVECHRQERKGSPASCKIPRTGAHGLSMGGRCWHTSWKKLKLAQSLLQEFCKILLRRRRPNLRSNDFVALDPLASAYARRGEGGSCSILVKIRLHLPLLLAVWESRRWAANFVVITRALPRRTGWALKALAKTCHDDALVLHYQADAFWRDNM